MADDEQNDEQPAATPTEPDSTAENQATENKPATRKKSAVKKKARVKKVAKPKSGAAAASTIPPEKAEAPIPDSPEIPRESAEKPEEKQAPPSSASISTPPRRFWPKALIMVFVVIVLFSYIREMAKGPQDTVTPTSPDLDTPSTDNRTQFAPQMPGNVQPDNAMQAPEAMNNRGGYPGYGDHGGMQQPYYPMVPRGGYGTYPPQGQQQWTPNRYPAYPMPPQGGYGYGHPYSSQPEGGYMNNRPNYPMPHQGQGSYGYYYPPHAPQYPYYPPRYYYPSNRPYYMPQHPWYPPYPGRPLPPPNQ